MAAENGNASRLKYHREQAGLSQAALAKLAGVSLRTVTNYEWGRVRNPRLDTLKGLAAALGMTLDELTMTTAELRAKRRAEQRTAKAKTPARA